MPPLCCPAGHLWDSTPGEAETFRCPTCGQEGIPWPSDQARTIALSEGEPAAQTVSRDAPLAVTESATPPACPPLPQVPGYEITGVLNRGGMGVVYRARHVRLNLPVALKMILSSGGASAEALSRFHREAQAVAAINHPGVVRLYNYGEHQGQPYFSMEYVEGGSLADRLRGGPLPVGDAARLVEEAARVMQHVHERGIVHRDLKPGNVLLQGPTVRGGAASPGGGAFDSVPKIADFGLARYPADSQSLTSTGVAVGTPEFMAPEQARGERGIGPLCDVYGLGAVLYAALTGQPPFRGESPELTRMQVLLDEPRRPTAYRSDIPPELEAICLKCLEKDPSQRYGCAKDLADDLSCFRQGLPVSIRDAGPMDWHARWARGLGYKLLDLIGAGRTGFLYMARQINLDRVVALKLLPEATTGDPDLHARFRREAAAIARLQHPNIVQIFDFGERSGWSYFTMEYIDGGSLAKVFAAAPPPPRRAVEIVSVVARAIDYAHERGHAHCSLRPASVGLTSSGHVKVARFGLAQVLGEDRRARWAPLEDRRLPSYLAPEQVQGGDVGPATDVYGLGALLYGLLTNQPPFVAATLQEVREAVLGRDPVPPRQLRPEVVAEVEALCLACLAKDPSARPASARVVAEQLEQFLSR